MRKTRTILHQCMALFILLALLGGLGLTPQPALQSVIVQAASAEQAAALVAKYGGDVTSQLAIINGVGARMSAAGLAGLRGDPAGARVTDNAKTELTRHTFEKPAANSTAADYSEVVGANLVWETGQTGQGVTVAVLDTGIAQHAALKKDINGKPRSLVVAWADFVDGKKVQTDPNGHGTHIAGIIASASLGSDGAWNGIAPGVNIVGVRVLDHTGTGDYEKVINGIQWVLENKDTYNIKVMNLSLHALVQSPYWADPLNQAVMRAWAEGITVVIAAGNDGPNPMSISVPGNNPYAITVGAFTDNYTPFDWDDDYLASFSAAGPTLDGFVKPDLLAPGAHMVAPMSPGSYIARNHEANWVDAQSFSMAGTSQSAAVVSGVVSMVLAHQPELTPEQVKFRLMVTSLPWINDDQTDVLYSIWQQGAGRVNAYDAVFATDVLDSANYGMDIWADLNGLQHYEGYSYYDEEAGVFRLHGAETLTDGYGSWAGKYGSWAGKYGSWAGKYGSWAGKYGSWAGGYGSWAGKYGSWAGGYGSWAGGYGSWAGGYGSWAGGYGSWAGAYGSWAGGYGSWAGGYGSWAGGYGSWAGRYGVWAGQLTDPTFIANFMDGVGPNVNTTKANIKWVEE